MQHETFDRSRDARVRAAAFEWLAGQVAIHGDAGDAVSSLYQELLELGKSDT